MDAVRAADEAVELERRQQRRPRRLTRLAQCGWPEYGPGCEVQQRQA